MAASDSSMPVVLPPMAPTLSAEFARASRNFRRLDEGDFSSVDPSFQKEVRQCYAQFQRLTESSDRAGVFSSNEELDDIGTGDLKLLLNYYYLGDLSLKMVDSMRLDHLKDAKGHLDRFLSRMLKLNLIRDEDKAILQREVPADAVTKRNERIARFKREKQVSARLAEINERREKVVGSLKGSDADAIDDADFEALASRVGNAQDLEDLEREYTLLLIDSCVRRSTDHLQMISQEMEVLSFARQQQAQAERRGEIAGGPGRPGSAAGLLPPGAARPPPGSGAPIRIQSLPPNFASQSFVPVTGVMRINQSDIKHLQPAGMAMPQQGPVAAIAAGASAVAATGLAGISTYGVERERMAGQVFADRNPFSMYAEEWAEMKMKTDPSFQATSKPPPKQPEADDSDDEESDKAQAKARSWDDWKDANPRGSGNTGRR